MASYFRTTIMRHGIATIIMIAVSLWSMYPVLAHPQSHVIGWKGDNVLYAYMTGWFADSLLEGRSPFVDPGANYPDQLPLAGNEAPFLSMLLVAPLTWLFGPVFGYNAIMFLSALLSGVVMYLWIYRVTGSRFGGLVAGLILILTPYRIVRNYGHLNLISIQALPLFFWSLDVLRRNPRPGRLHLAAVGGAVFLVGCMSQYYLVISALTGVAYAIFGLAAQWKPARPRPAPIRSTASPGRIDGGAPHGNWGIHWLGLATSGATVLGAWALRGEAHPWAISVELLGSLPFLALIGAGAALLLRWAGVRRSWVAGGGALLAAMSFTSTVTLGQHAFFWRAAAGAAVWGLIGALALLRGLRATMPLSGGLQYLLSAAAGAVLSALPYLINRQNTTYKAYPIEDTRWFSASPENFLVPSRLHPLWGEWVDRTFSLANRLEGGWIEHTAYLGAVTVALALAALFWRRTPHRRQLAIWGGTMVTAALFALGTDLHLAGRPVSPQAPDWLPMYYLGRLPVISLMRVWARFSIVVIVLATAMAGVGAAHVAAGIKKAGPRRLAMACVAILALLDLAPGRLDSSLLEPRGIDRWLAGQPGQFAAAFLPAGVEPFPALFGRLTHGKAIPALNHSHHRPPAFDDFERRARDFPAPSSLERLRALDLRFLLVNLNAYDAAERDRINRTLAATPQGRIVGQVNEWMVFEFK
ncbi:MAG TPA: hypothetical protein VD886_05825 [Herpetosiphonaceae bacterium]|nr:hypothetical protein [Herpetosiphonaceae bacterium]